MQNIRDSSAVDSNFGSMAYDKERGEDFSKILEWLAVRNNMITSIVNGEWKDSFAGRDKLLIGDSVASVGLTTDEVFEKVLHALGQNEKGETDGKVSRQLGPDEKLSRTERFKKMMDGIKLELCMAESIATRIPLWQVQEYDRLTWTGYIDASEDAPHNGNSLMLMQPSRRDYSLGDLLSRFVFPALFSDRKFVLGLCTGSPEDNSCILPIAYLIEALNKAQIRKTPIDLLLLDRGQQDGRWETLLLSFMEKSMGSQIYVGGDLKSFRHLSLHLAQGVSSPSYSRVKGIHFVVDSSADVHTAIESISTKVWTSGSQVISGARSLLFVHQSIYGVAVEGMKKKLNRLHTEMQPTVEKADFIRRSQPSIIDPMETFRQGAKVISTEDGDLDFTYPSVVYDIGTSASLVTSSVAGSGHILVIIPYRSVSELVSLANNFDIYNETYVFASNVDFFSTVAKQLKAKTVQLNTTVTEGSGQSSGRLGVGGFQGYAVVSGKINSEIPSGGKSWTDDKCMKTAIEAARAAQKTWSSAPLSVRTAALERFLCHVIKNNTGITEEQKLQVYGDFLKALGTSSTSSSGGDGDGKNLYLKSSQPVGIVGILFVNLEGMSLGTRLLPILMSTLKGNVSIVMSVSHPDPNNLQATMQNAATASLPTGVVTFLQFPTIEDAKRWGFQDPTRFNLLWIVQGTGINLPLLSLQELDRTSSCSRVIIDTETHPGTVIPNLQKRLVNLHIPKTIIL